MILELLKGKIHRAVITNSALDYIGSITIDENWLEASGILPNEKVLVVNNNNGNRFETYVIKGDRGSKIICVNGAASRLISLGDIVIIIAFALMSPEEASVHVPKVIFPQEDGSYITIEQIVELEIQHIIDSSLYRTDDMKNKVLKDISIKYGYTIGEIIEKYNNLNKK